MINRIVSVVGAALLVGVGLISQGHAESPSLALAVVYDTSGSMREFVRGKDGKMSEKYLIGNKALTAIVDRVAAYQKATQPAPKIEFTLVTFGSGNGQAAIPLSDFAPEKIRQWARSFREPNGATPLGAAIEFAAQSLVRSTASQKHVLVITDGMNTVGPDPATVVRGLQKQKGTESVFLHVVAFDVDARVFAPLKQAGVTLVAAADEKQLQEQLNFILEEKILLEAEEPKKK